MGSISSIIEPDSLWINDLLFDLMAIMRSTCTDVQ